MVPARVGWWCGVQGGHARAFVPGWLLKGGTSTSWLVFAQVASVLLVSGSPGGDGKRGCVGPAWHAVGS